MTDYEQEILEREKHLADLETRPEWAEWLAGMDTGLTAFFTNLVPDMPDSPYSEVGLRHAELAALETFPNWKSASIQHSPNNAELIDPFVRFIGEAFVRSIEAKWRYSDLVLGGDPRPVVEPPFSDIGIAPGGLLASVAQRRTGRQLEGAWRRQRALFRQWVDAGRPTLAVWLQARAGDDGVDH